MRNQLVEIHKGAKTRRVPRHVLPYWQRRGWREAPAKQAKQPAADK